MCGIAGYVSFGAGLPETFLSDALSLLHHRGPDDKGEHHQSFENCKVGIGNARLSIIDLSEKGHQPFLSDCGNFALVFNGIIYNYKELKAELISQGVNFKSNCDTEVLLKAYMQWPETFLEKINGIYAIAILNKPQKKLLLIRDKIGVKPIFYHISDTTIIFASELRVFLKQPVFEKKICKKALNLYLQYGYFPAPYSALENVYKLCPGELISIDLEQKKITKDKYWDLNLEEITEPSQNTNLHLTLKQKIENSIESRLVADVPVGVLLSGGFDSSLVAAIAQQKTKTPVKTFTIGFKEKQYNEAPFAAEIASFLKTDHTELYIDENIARDIITSLGKTFDEPMGDSGAVPLLLVTQLASKEVKVLLSAEGGDELFGGYPTYFKALQISSLSRYIPWPFKNSSNRYLNILAKRFPLNTYKSLVQYFTEREAEKLCNTDNSHSNSVKAKDPLNSLLLFDIKNYLPEDLLMKADRCMMASSIENRDPLLNPELVQFASQIPENLKCPENKPKHLLKQIAYEYIPKELLDRPKKGFSIPVGKWLSEELLSFTELKINNLSKRGILNSSIIQSTFIKFKQKPEKYYSRQIWVLLAFELWMEEWMN